MNEREVIPPPTDQAGPYLIRSLSEQGYWSNTLGWVYDVGSATCFEDTDGTLPVTRGDDAEFVRQVDAGDFDPDTDNGVRCTRCGREWPDGHVPRIVVDAGTVGESRSEACDQCLSAAHLVDVHHVTVSRREVPREP